MRTHRSGFPVSGSQGMGNRETVSNSLISISLTLPGEASSPRMPGKPICHLPMTLHWNEAMLSIADGRAERLLAGTGGADIAVAI